MYKKNHKFKDGSLMLLKTCLFQRKWVRKCLFFLNL